MPHTSGGSPGPILVARVRYADSAAPCSHLPAPYGFHIPAVRTLSCRTPHCRTQDEMRSGLSYFSTVIFDVVPVFHRRVDTALEKLGLPRLPLDRSLFK